VDPLDAVAVRLRPHVALHVGDPCAAHVEVGAPERTALQPDASADPVARLEHSHRVSARLELARRDEPGEAGADDDDVAGVRPVALHGDTVAETAAAGVQRNGPDPMR
jgi:hypothetical protein